MARAVIVSITAKGKSLFQRMARESEQIYASIERRIGSKELKLLYELLDRAIHVAGEQESN